MPRIVEPAGEQRSLVDRGGDYPVNITAPGHGHRALDGDARQPSRRRGIATVPRARRLVRRHISAGRTHHREVSECTQPAVPERAGHDLGPDTPRVAESDGESRTAGLVGGGRLGANRRFTGAGRRRHAQGALARKGSMGWMRT